jgi:ribonuclease-3
MTVTHIPSFDEKRSQIIIQLAERLGLSDVDPHMLHLALCHSSYANEQDNCENFGNERLEFLGDAIIGFVVTEKLYNDYPDLREGQLSKIKSIVVSKRILARCSNNLGLGEHLLLGKGEEQTGGRTRFSILGNLFESIVGAIHLSSGMQHSKRFINEQLEEEIEKAARGESIIDHKSILQEQVQKQFGVLPLYRIVSSTGPDHDKDFVVEVHVKDRCIGHGKGKSKKRAEKSAASDALDYIQDNGSKLFGE